MFQFIFYYILICLLQFGEIYRFNKFWKAIEIFVY